MINRRPTNTTRVLGKSQGYIGLPIRDTVYEDGTRTMISAWEPTPAELAAIQAGASIYVEIYGAAHPPIKVYVDEP